MTLVSVNTLATSKPFTTGVIRFVANCLAAKAQRAALKNLDDHLLADIGLTYKAACKEAKSASWSVPKGWHA